MTHYTLNHATPAINTPAKKHNTVLPFLVNASLLVGLASLLLLLPRSFIRSARGIAGLILFTCSFLHGITCWLYSFVATLRLLGTGWLIAGLLFAGVGVLPLALI